MLNGNEWQQLHSDFLSDTHHLLNRADECLSHLELISDDRDAVECLLVTLQQIAAMADAAGVSGVASFARQLRYLLYFAGASGRLLPKALVSLRQCLALLSWQVELIDPFTGVLLLDEDEQQELLEQFGCCCGIGHSEGSEAVPLEWPVPLPLNAPDVGSVDQADRSGTR
jgi:hypothetical protein